MFLVNSLFNFQRPHRLSDFYILSNLLFFVKNFFSNLFFNLLLRFSDMYHYSIFNYYKNIILSIYIDLIALFFLFFTYYSVFFYVDTLGDVAVIINFLYTIDMITFIYDFLNINITLLFFS